MRVLVCVPGTCNHAAGFSDAWWSALSPFTKAYDIGTLGITRFEVLWSDLISDTPYLGQAWAGCSAGFFQYLYDDPTRMAIIARFQSVVLPLLKAGYTIDVLAHSEGTIIAYEGLADFNGRTAQVANFFTLGTALGYAWNPLVPTSNVRDQLLPSNQGGDMPMVVAKWWNIYAANDPFASPLGPAYEVSHDFGPMPAVGCSEWDVDPVCIHNSYFNPANTAVLKDIVAAKINAA